MTTRSIQIRTILFVAVVLSVGLFLFDGCKKSEDTLAQKTQEMHDHEGHEPAAMEAEPAAQTASVIEQETCPVMGAAINKDLFTEYKGKKVYFCCEGCEEKFLANPEQYVAQLPQFKQ